MKYKCIPACELTLPMIIRWEKIIKSNHLFVSPYFNPKFTLTLSEIRDDISIGLIEDNDQIRGFFPFHLKKGGLARPVGLGLSDYHGIIADSETECKPEELMKACRIKRWEFDHLPVWQKMFSRYHKSVSDSPIIDVANGFEAYLESLDKGGRKQLKETQRKKIKLSDQKGAVDFIFHSEKKEILKQMMEWKSEQCQRTGTVDYFKLDWCKEFIDRLHSINDSDFGGTLSCLYAGGELAAVHFGIYTEKVFHSWFPGYNHEMEEFSPGSILLFEIIKTVAENGFNYIDLGKGVSLYKKRVMTGSISVAEGRLLMPSFRNSMLIIKEQAEAWGRRSIFRSILKIPGRIIMDRERKGRYE